MSVFQSSLGLFSDKAHYESI